MGVLQNHTVTDESVAPRVVVMEVQAGAGLVQGPGPQGEEAAEGQDHTQVTPAAHLEADPAAEGGKHRAAGPGPMSKMELRPLTEGPMLNVNYLLS